MKQAVLSLCCVCLILSIAAVRCFIYWDIAVSGIEMLVPVFVHKIEDEKVFFRYGNIIPVGEITEKSGVIVVRRSSSKQVVFVRPYNLRIPLRPHEHLLKYDVVYEESVWVNTGKSKINFAADVYAVKTGKTSPPSRKLDIVYAVIKADEKGNAVLSGLADRNGFSF